MFVTHPPAPLPFVASGAEPRVTAPQPVKAPSFANLLRQNQHPTPRPTHAAPPPAAAAKTAAPATGDAAASATSPDDSNPPTAGRTRSTTADKARKSPSTAAASATTTTRSNDDGGEADAPTDEAGASAGDTPSLAHAMSHLRDAASQTRPDPLTAATEATAAAGATQPDNDIGAALTAGIGNETDTAADAVTTADDRHRKAERGPADPAASLRAAAADDALAPRRGGTAADHDAKAAFALPIDAGTALLPTASAFAAHAATGAARSAEPGPAAVLVTIATPVTAPEFPQSLGVQLSVLAAGGIQHAELHLNPADMGPVSVQIEMNGNQAQIDFGADVAATRQAIEAGLPELASALRDAGFTLSGGGVSQHPRGGSEPDAERGGRARRGAREAAGDGADLVGTVANGARRSVTLGGLDLYA